MPMIESVRPVGGSGLGTKGKKAGQKSRLVAPSATNSNKNLDDADDEIDDDEPTPKLPPGLVLKPPKSVATTSGIGRGFGLPVPSSRLQFSRSRQGNGANGQGMALSSELNNEFDNKRDHTSMEIDKPDHH